jgi:hydrogenase-4 membrane subunit HyfE
MVLFASVYIVADKRIAPKKDYYAFFYGLFIAIVSYILVLTMAKENAIVIVSLLFTPVALALKNLEKRIENEKKQEEDTPGSEN